MKANDIKYKTLKVLTHYMNSDNASYYLVEKRNPTNDGYDTISRTVEVINLIQYDNIVDSDEWYLGALASGDCYIMMEDGKSALPVKEWIKKTDNEFYHTYKLLVD